MKKTERQPMQPTSANRTSKRIRFEPKSPMGPTVMKRTNSRETETATFRNGMTLGCMPKSATTLESVAILTTSSGRKTLVTVLGTTELAQSYMVQQKISHPVARTCLSPSTCLIVSNMAASSILLPTTPISSSATASWGMSSSGMHLLLYSRRETLHSVDHHTPPVHCDAIKGICARPFHYLPLHILVC